MLGDKKSVKSSKHFRALELKLFKKRKITEQEISGRSLQLRPEEHDHLSV
jgi:hypothetical protein